MRLPPTGTSPALRQAIDVNSGNRKVFSVCLLVAGISFSASEARAPAIPQMGMAPEYGVRLPQVMLIDCPTGEYAQRAELRFEMIRRGEDVDPETLRALLSRGSRRSVDFDWNPIRGELSYDPAIMLPEDPRAATAGPATAHCESR